MIDHLKINKGVETILPRKKEEKKNYLLEIKEIITIFNYEIIINFSIFKNGGENKKSKRI